MLRRPTTGQVHPTHLTLLLPCSGNQLLSVCDQRCQVTARASQKRMAPAEQIPSASARFQPLLPPLLSIGLNCKRLKKFEWEDRCHWQAPSISHVCRHHVGRQSEDAAVVLKRGLKRVVLWMAAPSPQPTRKTCPVS